VGLIGVGAAGHELAHLGVGDVEAAHLQAGAVVEGDIHPVGRLAGPAEPRIAEVTEGLAQLQARPGGPFGALEAGHQGRAHGLDLGRRGADRPPTEVSPGHPVHGRGTLQLGQSGHQLGAHQGLLRTR
jgi:hypothetical protein